ncbi:unnamed protein product, partial [marine sediment metagenome]
MTLTRVACAGAIMLACLSAWGQQDTEQPADQDADRVLATVDGTSITESELWWYMTQLSGGRLLDDLILSRLLAAEAEEQGVKVSGPDV